MTKQTKLLAIGALLLVVLLYVGLRREKIEEPTPIASRPSETAARAERAALRATGTNEVRPASLLGVDPQLIEHIRARYGAKISNRYVQVKLIEALMRHFQKLDPRNWREALLAAVRAAFPDRYDEIAQTLDKRLDYEKWMKENQARLNELDADERRAEIRRERERLFGKEEADEIWASEYKNQAVGDTLKEIDAQDGSVGDKLSTYKERLEEIYEDQYDQYVENHRHEAMNRFVGLDSVQAQLDGMSAEERKASLREIREGMGLDAEALKRWDVLDADRDARWETGNKYMAERAALVEAYGGKELEEKLDELRRRYFGTEAEVIAAEEGSGLFRFNRPRKWGQN